MQEFSVRSSGRVWGSQSLGIHLEMKASSAASWPGPGGRQTTAGGLTMDAYSGKLFTCPRFHAGFWKSGPAAKVYSLSDECFPVFLDDVLCGFHILVDTK